MAPRPPQKKAFPYPSGGTPQWCGPRDDTDTAGVLAEGRLRRLITSR